MNRYAWCDLRRLERRQVSVALTDGSRLANCELVSAGRWQLQKLWLVVDGIHTFLPPTEVLAIWESPSARPEAA